MKAITYRVYLEQPLLATQILGDPNSSVSFDYIPGSQMRGMLIHRYYERHGMKESAVASDPDCQRLFFNSTTRYLHAYPLVENGARSLPVPLALLRRKSDDLREVSNASHEDWTDIERREQEQGDTLKPLGRIFCVVEDAQIALYQPKPNHVAVHVLRERAKGRATVDKGAVFQYDALAAGQWFAGVILADSDEDAASIRALLQGDAWLGRSRSAGYGKVQIEPDAEHNDPWREIGGSAPALVAGQYATLTLLSDAILREEDGRPAIILDDNILSSYLGVLVTIDIERSFSTAVPHGGFNRTWRLPLTQSYALAAGSVIAFKPAQAIDKVALQQLEQQGIGERRVEGFGRIAFNWLDELVLTAYEGSLFAAPQISQKLSPTSVAIARQMARRLLEQQIDERIARFVRDEVIEKQGVTERMPRNSQLGRVRLLLRRAAQQGNDLTLVQAGLASFKDASKRQFDQARMINGSLWEWLNGLLANPPSKDVWEMIGLPEAQRLKVASEPAPHDMVLTRAMTLRLIDATLAAATRARKKEQ